jgi:hypothetical protein
MKPETLASGAILIAAWYAQEERAAGERDADIDRMLGALRPVHDLVGEIARRDESGGELFGMLGRVSDDGHARAALQRQFATELLAEPALYSELITMLLQIGEIRTSDGVTCIDIPRPATDQTEGQPDVLVSVQLLEPSVSTERLTPPTENYVGRGGELEEVLRRTESADEGVQVIAVSGAAGYGTTTFARVIAERMHRGKSSRLQIEVPLTVPDPASLGREVVRSPEDALFSAIVALGIPEREIPPSLDQRAAQYRSAVTEAAQRSGTRPLILLDDARRLDQLRYFLPACPGTILVTGDHLALRPGLERTSLIELGPLSVKESFQLLASRRNTDQGRFGSTPEGLSALQRLVQLCFGVPLSLAIMSGVLERAATTGERLTTLAAQLEQAYHESDAIEVRPVFAALRVSYPRLTLEQRHVLHAAGLLRLPVMDLNVIAAASGLSPEAARIILEQLTSRSLLETFGLEGDRWRVHRLVSRFLSEIIPEPLRAQREQIITAAAHLYLRRAQSLSGLLGFLADRPEPAIVAWAQEQVQAQRVALSGLLRAALSLGLTKVARLLALSVTDLMERAGAGPEAEAARSVGSVIDASRRAADRSLESRAFSLLGKQAERSGQQRSARNFHARADALRRAAAASGQRENRPVGSDSDGTHLDSSGRTGTGPGGSGPGGSGPGGSGPGGSGPGGSGSERSQNEDLEGGSPRTPKGPGPADSSDNRGPGAASAAGAAAGWAAGAGGWPRGGAGSGGSGKPQSSGGGHVSSGGGGTAGADSNSASKSSTHSSIERARGGGQPTIETTFGSPRQGR